MAPLTKTSGVEARQSGAGGARAPRQSGGGVKARLKRAVAAAKRASVNKGATGWRP